MKNVPDVLQRANFLKSIRINHLDIILDNFDLAERMLELKLQTSPIISDYGFRKNTHFHDKKFKNRISIYGNKRIDLIKVSHKIVWRRHFWIRRF